MSKDDSHTEARKKTDQEEADVATSGSVSETKLEEEGAPVITKTKTE
jgi:hypothetical protein